MVSIQKKFRYHCISFTRPDRSGGHIECEAYRDVVMFFNYLVSPLLNQNSF
jgi:hypothetical protein